MYVCIYIYIYIYSYIYNAHIQYIHDGGLDIKPPGRQRRAPGHGPGSKYYLTNSSYISKLYIYI